MAIVCMESYSKYYLPQNGQSTSWSVNLLRDATFKSTRDKIIERVEISKINPDRISTDFTMNKSVRRWESIAVITRAIGLTKDSADAEEFHAVSEVAMLMSIFFNAAVLCLPGTATQHGFDESWNIECKAFVTGVFASWGF